MSPDLSTTNTLLGIMAAISVLEALAVIGLLLGGFLIHRQMVHVLRSIQEQQVAPAAARVNAILDDIRDVTSTAKHEAKHARWVVGLLVEAFRRRRPKAGDP
jgi:hypothetical protein